jgi:hypothetical protein
VDWLRPSCSLGEPIPFLLSNGPLIEAQLHFGFIYIPEKQEKPDLVEKKLK